MSEQNEGRKCFVVLLLSEPTLATAVSWPIKAFRLGDTLYKDIGLGQWTGFYDWLRSADGELLGVRYWPAVRNEPFFEAVRALSYAHVDAKGFLEIHFWGSGVADPRRSCDQEFLYDAVFRSDRGEWAIAFDVTALKPSDFDRLHNGDLTWTVVRLDS